MKIFYLEFFINEIFSVKEFPNYGIIIIQFFSPAYLTQHEYAIANYFNIWVNDVKFQYRNNSRV